MNLKYVFALALLLPSFSSFAGKPHDEDGRRRIPISRVTENINHLVDEAQEAFNGVHEKSIEMSFEDIITDVNTRLRTQLLNAQDVQKARGNGFWQITNEDLDKFYTAAKGEVFKGLPEGWFQETQQAAQGKHFSQELAKSEKYAVELWKIVCAFREVTTFLESYTKSKNEMLAHFLKNSGFETMDAYFRGKYQEEPTGWVNPIEALVTLLKTLHFQDGLTTEPDENITIGDAVHRVSTLLDSIEVVSDSQESSIEEFSKKLWQLARTFRESTSHLESYMGWDAFSNFLPDEWKFNSDMEPHERLDRYLRSKYTLKTGGLMLLKPESMTPDSSPLVVSSSSETVTTSLSDGPKAVKLNTVPTNEKSEKVASSSSSGTSNLMKDLKTFKKGSLKKTPERKESKKPPTRVEQMLLNAFTSTFVQAVLERRGKMGYDDEKEEEERSSDDE